MSPDLSSENSIKMSGCVFHARGEKARPVMVSGPADAVGGQDIRKGYHAQKSVNVGTAHYRQYVDLVRSHALEREIETLVGVDVGKLEWIDQVNDLLVCAFREFFFQPGKSDDTSYPACIQNQPSSKFTLPNALRGFLRREFGRQ